MLPTALRDVYFRPEYVRMYERDGARAECAVVRDGARTWLMPYLRRPLELLGDGRWDFETAYGYGGPLSSADDPGWIESVWSEFTRHAADAGAVAGFVRFHPLLGNERFVGSGCVTRPERTTVAMDLELAEEEMWSEVHSKHRNSIRRAERLGCEFSYDERLDRLAEFEDVYLARMADLGAADFYRFDRTYFERLRQLPDGEVALACVDGPEGLVAAGVFLVSERYGHYHLAAGTRTELSGGAANLLVWRAALELRLRGVGKLHLGGGATDAPDDPLLRFKARFSDEAHTFHVGLVTIDEGAYREACTRWEQGRPPDSGDREGVLLKWRT